MTTSLKTWRSRGARVMLALAAAAAGGTAVTAARAQDVPAVISPLRVESDHNGVNLVSGKTTIGTPVLSVPGAPNLRFDRVQNAAPYVSGRVTGGGPDQPNSRSYSVHTGTGTSESFQCVDYDCTSVTGSGSTFIWNTNFYRQAGSGARWHFNLQHVVTSGPNQSLLYYASNVTYPNGEVITYTYDTYAPPGDPFNRVFYRPSRITSNLGFFISLAYQSNDFNVAGWAQVAQATSYRSGPPETPLRTLTYNAGGTTITDLGDGTGPARVYTCTGCTNQLGVNLEVGAGSNQLPGEASPASQVAAVPNLPEQSGGVPVGSVTRDGVAWTYAYDNLRYETGSQSWLYDHLTVTGPNGFHNVYNLAAIATSTTTHRLVLTGMTDSIGRYTALGFDEAYRPVLMVSPEGNQVEVGYDEYGNINWRRTRAKPGSGLPDIWEEASYPTGTCFDAGTPILCYRPTWSRDGLGRQTDYAYNALGQLIEQTDPADAEGVRRKTTIAYETSTGLSRRSVVRVCGDTTTCGTNAEIRTEYEYWGSTFLPIVERRVDASTGTIVALETRYSYDLAGRVLSVDGPLPGNADTTHNRYDVHGRKTWEVGALAPNGLHIATRTNYRDSDDKVLSTETGTIPDAASTNLTILRRTDFDYDGRRNPIRESVSGSGTTYSVAQRSFDDRGSLECSAVRMNPAAFASLPASACTLGTEGTHGPDRITRTIYDAAGQRLQLREGVGTSDEGTEASWAYNLNGQVTTIIDGNGNRAILHYDGHGRQDRWTFPSTTRPPSFDDTTQANALATAGSVNALDYEEYGYDTVGNRTSLRKRDGSVIGYQYDALNRMIVKIVPSRADLSAAQTRDIFYSYDLRGLPLSARFDSASGEGVTNAYDGFGRLVSTTTNLSGATRTLAYQYDAAGNRTRITHPDGTWFDNVYDSMGRQTYLANASGWMVNLNYHDHGMPWVFSRANATWSGWFYDAIQRPLALGFYPVGSAHGAAWTYGRNPAGQLASIARDNDAYAWTGHYAASRAYTTDGLNRYSAAGSASFGYDANGNLTSDGARTYGYDIENRLVSTSNGAALVYDPLGRLFQLTGTAGTTTFLYDGDALVAEYGGATMIRRHVHWVGADVPMVTYEGAGLTAPRHLFADHQGSIVAATDASGGPAWINRYDEYGIPGAANQGRFQYTGQAWLPELGMYYYKARIYSPTLGRFLQTDPVGYEGGINLYAYVGNDPVNHVDPSGTHMNCIIDPQGGCEGGRPGPGINWLQQQQTGTRPQARRDRERRRDQAAAEAIYGETGGLYPSQNPRSAAQLEGARRAIGTISERNPRVWRTDGSRSLNPIEAAQWRRAEAAARNRHSTDIPANARWYYIRNADHEPQAPRQRPELGRAIHLGTYGSRAPFVNVGGGDVPRGNNVVIDIYHLPDE